jgi:hypothetical protein
MKTVGYVRVSTDRHADLDVSLEELERANSPPDFRLRATQRGAAPF